jgi:hypothetical protein
LGGFVVVVVVVVVVIVVTRLRMNLGPQTYGKDAAM